MDYVYQSSTARPVIIYKQQHVTWPFNYSIIYTHIQHWEYYIQIFTTYTHIYGIGENVLNYIRHHIHAYIVVGILHSNIYDIYTHVRYWELYSKLFTTYSHIYSSGNNTFNYLGGGGGDIYYFDDW